MRLQAAGWSTLATYGCANPLLSLHSLHSAGTWHTATPQSRQRNKLVQYRSSMELQQPVGEAAPPPGPIPGAPERPERRHKQEETERRCTATEPVSTTAASPAPTPASRSRRHAGSGRRPTGTSEEAWATPGAYIAPVPAAAMAAAAPALAAAPAGTQGAEAAQASPPAPLLPDATAQAPPRSRRNRNGRGKAASASTAATGPEAAGDGGGRRGGGSGRGRGGGRSGGGGGVDSSGDTVRVSKKLSWALRHGMQELGLDMSPDGFVSLSDLLSKKGFGGISVDTVRHVVATNDKQRFALKEGEGGAGLLIRANQGHSVKTVDAEQLLTPVTSAGDVPVCVHGTYKRAWPDILASGALLPMSRTHVHFAASIPPAIQARRQRTEPAAAGGERASTASAAAADDDSSAQPQLGSDEGGAEADANSTGGEQFGECAPGERAQEQSSLSAGAAVVSGLRANCQLLVHADVAKAMARGVAFYTSANGVILAPSLPLACVALVEDLTQGGAAIFRDGAPI